MEKILSFFFPDLSVEDKVLLRRVIRAQRAQILNDTLGRARSSDLSEKLGSRAREVEGFLAEMVFLFKQDPDLFWQVLDGWPAPFCLSRLLIDPEGLDDEDHLDQVVSNLNALLLVERVVNGSPGSGQARYLTKTDTLGRIPGLLQDVFLELSGDRYRGRKVEWFCLENELSARLAGDKDPAFTIRIPMEENPHMRLVPIAGSQAGDFPIIEETVVFGKRMTRFIGAYADNDEREAEWKPLTLQESLTLAQQEIAELWPEALQWAEVLIPSFIDMGVPPGRIRFSSSYEPGSPIFMSRVDNHQIHAEDVVHEIQHHRLFLFGGGSHFKSWGNLRQQYVSPYRPDPRHIRGVLVGLHAFLTVNELKKRRIVQQERFSEILTNEMAEIHLKNLFAFRTVLDNEEFGDLGRELIKEMACTLAEHHSLIKTTTRPEILRQFEGQIVAHRAAVEKEAPELKNTSRDYLEWDEIAQLAAEFSKATRDQDVPAIP